MLCVCQRSERSRGREEETTRQTEIEGGAGRDGRGIECVSGVCLCVLELTCLYTVCVCALFL